MSDLTVKDGENDPYYKVYDDVCGGMSVTDSLKKNGLSWSSFARNKESRECLSHLMKYHADRILLEAMDVGLRKITEERESFGVGDNTDVFNCQRDVRFSQMILDKFFAAYINSMHIQDTGRKSDDMGTKRLLGLLKKK